MRFQADINYINHFALALKENPKMFQEKKKFIEAQLKSSQEIFKALCSGNFKKNAREYLKKRGLKYD